MTVYYFPPWIVLVPFAVVILAFGLIALYSWITGSWRDSE